MTDEYQDVHRSYGRCLRNRAFLQRFYTILMASHEAIPPAFARTDFARQRRALRRGITTALLYAGGSDIVSAEVERMAEVHSRRGRAPVEPWLYQYWLESLIQAVHEEDPQATPELEERWRAAMTPVIEAFKAAY